ncbi:MAG: LON peptidase substrate-binding domain-containing protein [Rhodothermaceae bacterium]|nr:LON peptidase substrate-binding domain-containing protein [Rhodothermaceae bacterium]
MSEPKNIPVFPLGLVLYPKELLPLHIFEDRYREMISYCLDEEAAFGVLLMQDGKMANVGCEAVIDRVVTTYEDGRMDIIVEGTQRFKVRDLQSSKSYMTADIEGIEEPEEPIQVETRERVITQHMRLLELAGRKVRPNIYQNLDGISFFIAHNVGLSSEQKQQVLEMLTENERIVFLASHLETLIPKVEEYEDVRKKVQSNGHFKDFPPEVE